MVGGAFDRAQAQVPNINLMPELKSKTTEEKEQEVIADKAYRESLRKIPNQSVNDPWGDVRGAGAQSSTKSAPKAAPKSDAAKSAAPKATQAKRQTKQDGATN
jgi:hypothetical protein